MTVLLANASARTRPLVLGLDVDGVLAEFTKAFVDVLARVTGRDLRSPHWRDELAGFWDIGAQLGYRRSQVRAAWHWIENSPDFWASLPPLPAAALTLRQLAEAASRDRIIPFFLTCRRSHTAHYQTVDWLQRHGYPAPTVVLAKYAFDKGRLASLLHLDLMVDDYDENITAIRRLSPTTTPVLHLQPWNRQFAVANPSIQSIGSIDEIWGVIDTLREQRIAANGDVWAALGVHRPM